MFRLLRYVWALPCTVTGLAAALLASLTRARWRLVEGVVEIAIAENGLLARAFHGAGLRFAAVTLGHVVIGLGEAQLARHRAHERVHVAQYERWGPLFFIAYPLCSLGLWLAGKRPYYDNPFEIEARTLAGEVSPTRKT